KPRQQEHCQPAPHTVTHRTYPTRRKPTCPSVHPVRRTPCRSAVWAPPSRCCDSIRCPCGDHIICNGLFDGDRPVLRLSCRDRPADLQFKWPAKSWSRRPHSDMPSDPCVILAGVAIAIEIWSTDLPITAIFTQLSYRNAGIGLVFAERGPDKTGVRDARPVIWWQLASAALTGQPYAASRDGRVLLASAPDVLRVSADPRTSLAKASTEQARRAGPSWHSPSGHGTAATEDDRVGVARLAKVRGRTRKVIITARRRSAVAVDAVGTGGGVGCPANPRPLT